NFLYLSAALSRSRSVSTSSDSPGLLPSDTKGDALRRGSDRLNSLPLDTRHKGFCMLFMKVALLVFLLVVPVIAQAGYSGPMRFSVFWPCTGNASFCAP